jgi:hypothetical protein
MNLNNHKYIEDFDRIISVSRIAQTRFLEDRRKELDLFFRDIDWVIDSWTYWFVHSNDRWRTFEMTRSDSSNCGCFENNWVIPSPVRVLSSWATLLKSGWLEDVFQRLAGGFGCRKVLIREVNVSWIMFGEGDLDWVGSGESWTCEPICWRWFVELDER